MIEGAAGIGKSTLMDEAAALAEAARMVVLRARGGIMEREFALGVVIQLLAPSIEPLGAHDARAAVRRRRRAGAPAVRGRPRPRGRPTIACSRASTACTGCARGSPRSMPLALLVDDAHWADEHSLRFLAYLEARIEELPACAILAVRTGEAARPRKR